MPRDPYAAKRVDARQPADSGRIVLTALPAVAVMPGEEPGRRAEEQSIRRRNPVERNRLYLLKRSTVGDENSRLSSGRENFSAIGGETGNRDGR